MKWNLWCVRIVEMSIDADGFVTIAAHAAEMSITSVISSKSVNMSEYFILSSQSSIISKMLIHRIFRLFLKNKISAVT